MRYLACVVCILPIIASCDQHPLPTETNTTTVLYDAGLPLTATMQFGDPGKGSPFPPQLEHDESLHAADKIVPRTVMIAAGGTVTFEVMPVHRVAVYDDGTKPSDISLAVLEPAPILGIPNFQINDPNNRLALESAANFLAPRTFEYTFSDPGRYLVICVTTPHFVRGDMYGWVIVR